MRVSAPVLQRWHLEVVLLGGSALRLCVALARSGQPVAAAVLAALTLASLWAELQYNAGLLGACHGCLRGLWSTGCARRRCRDTRCAAMPQPVQGCGSMLPEPCPCH